jgi:hypothetical protein
MLRTAFVLLVVACGGKTDAPETGIQSITLHATGGFIGEDLTYVISKDGTIVTTGHGADPTGTTHGSDVASLFENVRATQVLGVPAHSYVPDNPCCDRIEDDLVIVSGDGTTQAGPLEWDVLADGENAPKIVLSALQLVHTYIHAAK